jgi:CubicO group peptidase (beta-lactamase class C family)
VRDTQVIYLKGLGYADAEAKRKFTPQTVFYIASTTKSFTGLAASILDGTGTFELDAPLSRYLPQVRFAKPLRADGITIRSLLSHTHGISNDGPVPLRLAYTGDYRNNEHLIQLLSHHGAARNGRAYEYGNVGYNIATLAMDAVPKESWKETLRRLLFEPLRMTNTSAYISKFPTDHLAMPYRATETGFARIRYGKGDTNMQSAGGLVTTAADMGRWLEMHIGNGRVDGQQVIPAAAVAETHKTQATFSQNTQGLHFVGYGFGWQIALLGNDTLLMHGGGFPGFATHMSFIPGRRVGVAVMANNGELGPRFVPLVAQQIYRTLTTGEMISDDSLRAIRSQLEQTRSNIAADLARRAARPQSLPHPLGAYAGAYENPAFGRLELRVMNGKLEARMGAAWSAVEAYDASKNHLRLELFGTGEVAAVKMRKGVAETIEFGGMKFKRAGDG